MLDITAIVLTFNEELHIKRCIESLSDIGLQSYYKKVKCGKI